MDPPKLLFSVEQPHGAGELYLSWQKGKAGALLATTGTDGTIAVFNRHGSLEERMKLQGLCASMEWDNDGDLLAVITPSNPSVMLWECHANKRLSIETGLREAPSCLAWAKNEPLLAIGTQRGNVTLYNHHSTKRIPVIGKHTKKITCGAWNSDNILALASDDKTLSISNSEGDTLRAVTLRDYPNDLQFSEMKTDERVAGENTISLVIGKRTLYLYNLIDPENPIELAFQQKYGSIVTYKWYGDGYILIGFNAGYIIAISTHIKEVGQELFQVKNHKDNLTDIAMCNLIGQAATCGDDMVKLHSVWDTSEVIASLMPSGGADRCAWSPDGQLLAVAGRSYLNVYLSSLSPLFATHNTRAFLLNSLTEAILYQCIPGPEDIEIYKTEPYELLGFSLPVEPTLLALGPYHACCTANDAAWFFDLAQPASQPLQRQYSTAVTKIHISTEYAIAMLENKVMLHLIEQPDGSRVDRESKMFPEPALQEAAITSADITNDFFIFVTNMGHVQYFSLEGWKTIVRFRHSAGFRNMFCDPAGTRLVLVDSKNIGYIYNPINNDLIQIPDFPATYKGVLWDICLTERNVIIVYTDDLLYTYYCASKTINGSSIDFLGTSQMRKGQIPMIVCNGEVYNHCRGGSINKITLSSHETAGLADVDVDKRAANQKTHLNKLINLRKYNEAWQVCEALDNKELWVKLGEAAVTNLEVEFAIRVYTHLNDIAMVWSLEDSMEYEDLSVLCGRLCIALGRSEAAVRWLEGSTGGASRLALDLRASLLQWGRAAAIAAKAAPQSLPYINREHAAQMEFTGDYHEALTNYEKSIIDVKDMKRVEAKVKEHNDECMAGIARTSIRCGDIMRGITITMNFPQNMKLMKNSAQLLEEGKHFMQAASLYEQAGEIDRAASLYIKLRSWLKLEALLPKVTNPKIHLQYAKAKESEGRFPEALKAYMLAKDYDSAIRLNLEKFNDPDEAVQLVHESKSMQGAKMVAAFFQKLNDYTTAIKFLIISLCHEEAFQLARQHGKLQLYGEILIQSSTQARPDDFKSLAVHFEGEKNGLLAGKFFFHAKEYAKAMTHLLKSANNITEEDEAITLAIDTVASSNDDVLAKRLIEFLLGEVDGVPKEPKYVFRLYMARKQFQEAAKTAIIIANQEQVSGNYRTAHDMLLTMCQELRMNGLPVPADMRNSLMLLHSYILVRLHVKRGDHMKCARMLIRVANNISSFPSHVVPILTSTVIECQRAGLKKSAYAFAKVLMKSENRPQIDAKYVKKIESVIRHPPKGNDNKEFENMTPCPSCNEGLPETELICSNCGSSLPFCIATGCHIIRHDFTACPECDFPAIRSEILSLMEEDDQCPMCSEKVDKRKLIQIDTIEPYLLNTTAKD